MHKKHFYEAPDAELLVVRFEGNFCQTGVSDSPGNGFTVNDLGNLDDDD